MAYGSSRQVFLPPPVWPKEPLEERPESSFRKRTSSQRPPSPKVMRGATSVFNRLGSYAHGDKDKSSPVEQSSPFRSVSPISPSTNPSDENRLNTFSLIALENEIRGLSNQTLNLSEKRLQEFNEENKTTVLAISKALKETHNIEDIDKYLETLLSYTRVFSQHRNYQLALFWLNKFSRDLRVLMSPDQCKKIDGLLRTAMHEVSHLLFIRDYPNIKSNDSAPVTLQLLLDVCDPQSSTPNPLHHFQLIDMSRHFAS